MDGSVLVGRRVAAFLFGLQPPNPLILCNAEYSCAHVHARADREGDRGRSPAFSLLLHVVDPGGFLFYIDFFIDPHL